MKERSTYGFATERFGAALKPGNGAGNLGDGVKAIGTSPIGSRPLNGADDVEGERV